MNLEDQTRQLFEWVLPVLQKHSNVGIVHDFTATFTSQGEWVARMDYSHRGASKPIYGMLITGDKDRIEATRSIARRIYNERPSIIQLQFEMNALEIEDPGLEERLD